MKEYHLLAAAIVCAVFVLCAFLVLTVLYYFVAVLVYIFGGPMLLIVAAVFGVLSVFWYHSDKALAEEYFGKPEDK